MSLERTHSTSPFACHPYLNDQLWQSHSTTYLLFVEELNLLHLTHSRTAEKLTHTQHTAYNKRTPLTKPCQIMPTRLWLCCSVSSVKIFSLYSSIPCETTNHHPNMWKNMMWLLFVVVLCVWCIRYKRPSVKLNLFIKCELWVTLKAREKYFLLKSHLMQKYIFHSYSGIITTAYLDSVDAANGKWVILRRLSTRGPRSW